MSKMFSSVPSVFGGLSAEDREDLLRLRTLHDVPKVKYSTRLAMTVYPENTRMKKQAWGHIDLYKMVEGASLTMREMGVKPRSVVAMAAPTSFESAVFFLAAQWTGAITVMMGPDTSVDEMKQICQESAAAILVCPLVDENEKEDPNVELYNKCQTVCKDLNLISWHMFSTRNSGFMLETHGARAADRPAWHGGNKDLTLDPSEVSIRVIIPVQGKKLSLSLTQGNITAAVKEFKEAYALKPDFPTICSSPIYSIEGILVFMAALYTGGSVVIPRRGELNAKNFWTICVEDRIKWVSLPSAEVEKLYEATKDAGGAPAKGVMLNFIRSCPGFIKASDLQSMEKLFKVPVIESYGPPEASGLATSNLQADFKPGTLGKPLAYNKVLIVDIDTKTPLATNVKGDIAVSGPNVVLNGYDNDVDESAESKAVINGSEFLLTGDQGKIDERGYLVVFDEERTLKSTAVVARRREKEAAAAAAAAAASAAAAAAAAAAAEESRKKQEEEARKAAEAQKQAEEARLKAEEEQRLADEKAAREKAEQEEKARQLAEERASRSVADPADVVAALIALEATNDEMVQKHREIPQILADEAEWRNAQDAQLDSHVDHLKALAVQDVTVDQSYFGLILARVEALEKNTKYLEDELATKHKKEMDDYEAKLKDLEQQKAEADAQIIAARSALGVAASTPVLMEVNMKEIETQVAAAQDAVEGSHLSVVRAQEAAAKAKTDSQTEEVTRAALAAASAAAASAAAIASAHALAQQVLSEEPIPHEKIEQDELIGKTPDEYRVEKRMRINLEDIENAMKNHPSVKDCVAFGTIRPTDLPADEIYIPEVHCAVKARKGARMSPGWLRLHAQTMLPATLIPSKFYLVETFPPTRSGLAECPNIEEAFGKKRSMINEIKPPSWVPNVMKKSSKSGATGKSQGNEGMSKSKSKGGKKEAAKGEGVAASA